MSKSLDETPNGPRPGRWMQGLLIASLSINLAVAGMAVGGWVMHRGGGPMGGPHGGREPFRIFGPTGVGIYAHALSDDRRRALADDLQTQRRALFEGRRALRAHLARVAALLRAEPLDREALAREFADQRERATQQIALGQEAVLRLVSQMDAQERQALADALERRAHPPEPPHR